MPEPVVTPEPEMAPVDAPPVGSSIEDHEGMDAKLGHLLSEIIKDTSLSKAEKRKKAMIVLDLQDEGAGPGATEIAPEMEDEGDKEREEEDEEKEKKEAEKMEESIKLLKSSTNPKHKELAESMVLKLKEKKDLRKELDALKAKNSLEDRRAQARRLCEESALPKITITNVLVEQMAGKKTEKGMKAILEDRLALVNVKRPTSSQGYVGRKEGNETKGGTDMALKDFVESVNK